MELKPTSADNSETLEDAQEILTLARKRFSLSEEAEADIRRDFIDDLNFLAGDQWPTAIKQERELEGRPCLIINKLPQFTHQVTNDQRQNRPSIKVYPTTDGASQETAKIIQGIIRHIENNSNAETAYDTAFEGAARGSLGYFRIVTDFAMPDSFEQEIFIKRIRNPLSVFFDPNSSEPDGSDAEYAFITDDMSKEEYRALYPNSTVSSASFTLDSYGNDISHWVKSDNVRIAEYFYKEYREEKLYLLKTGEVVRENQLESKLMMAQSMEVDASVVKERTAMIPVVKWAKINGIEILDKTEWIGSHIPIIPVYGDEIYINGRRILVSVIRNAKDPQRMFNYWKSAETETIALAPKAPYVVAEGQLEGYEHLWKTANRKNHAFLYYKPVTIAGQMAPPPQRQIAEPATQAITQAAILASEDLKATTGIYDASLGQRSNEQSGIAILRRNNQSMVSNFHFIDNLSRSLRHAGRILVDIIPKVYDTARTARIIGDDGEQKLIRVNERFVDPQTGKEILYPLSVGRYDVIVDTGPSFATKRQEAATMMTELTRAYPQIMQIAGDLMVGNMDWQGARDIAERLKLMLPPELQNADKGTQIPPAIKAQIQQMAGMIENLSSALEQSTKFIETKKIELESKERIEFAKIQADIEMTLAKLGSESSIALLKQEVSAITERLRLLKIDEPVQVLPQEVTQNGVNPAVGQQQLADQQSFNPTGGNSPGIPME